MLQSNARPCGSKKFSFKGKYVDKYRTCIIVSLTHKSTFSSCIEFERQKHKKYL